MGPLIDPKTLYTSPNASEPCQINLLIDSHFHGGLNLQIAYPSVVITQWIDPLLSLVDKSESDVNCFDWFILIGQLCVGIDDSHQLGRKLPIVVTENNQTKLLPSLSTLNLTRRTRPIVLLSPAMLSKPKSNDDLTDLDEMQVHEIKLFEFLQENYQNLFDKNEFSILSSAYVQSKFKSLEFCPRWFDLFSQMGKICLKSFIFPNFDFIIF